MFEMFANALPFHLSGSMADADAHQAVLSSLAFPSRCERARERSALAGSLAPDAQAGSKMGASSTTPQLRNFTFSCSSLATLLVVRRGWIGITHPRSFPAQPNP